MLEIYMYEIGNECMKTLSEIYANGRTRTAFSIFTFVQILVFHMMVHYRKESIPTQNYEVCDYMRLKTYSQIENAVIKRSKVQTHNFDTSFLKTSKTGDGTKQF